MRDAEQWVSDYCPSNKPDLYAVALSYSEQRYDQAQNIFDALDKKADDLMRIAATLGAALVTVARLVGIGRPAAIIPSVGFLVASVVIAARCRWPAESKTPMDTRNLFLVVDNPTTTEKYVVEAVAAASHHAAAISLHVLIAWKAVQLKRSSWAFCIGLAALIFVPLLGGQEPASPTTNRDNRAALMNPVPAVLDGHRGTGAGP